MKSKKIMGIAFSSFLFLVFMSSIVSSIGLAPASKELLLTKNNFEYEIKIFNPNREKGIYRVDVSGDFSDYITLSENRIILNENDEFKTIKVYLNLPENYDLDGGEYVARIVVGKEAEETGQVVALMKFASKLILTVPYDGASVNIKVVTPNFIRNTNNNFAIEVENKGILDAYNCKAIIDLYNQENVKIISLSSEQKNIAPEAKETFLLPWSPNEKNGNYLAKTKFTCNNIEIIRENKFKIGSPEISIQNLSVDKFELGEIVKFDLLLSSNWGENIPNVFVNVELLKDDVQVANAKTESVNFGPFKKINVPFYIDTNGIQEGEYVITIKVNYLGKQIIESYEAYITPDNVIFNAISGKVVAEEEVNKTHDYSTILFIAIITVMIIGIFIVIILMHKHK